MAGIPPGITVAGPLTDVTQLPNGLAARSGELHVAITALRPDILRTRVWLGAVRPPDRSWAVLDDLRLASCQVAGRSDKESVGFATPDLVVRVSRKTGAIAFDTAAGLPLGCDHEDWPLVFQNGGFELSRRMLPDERFFGLGDQPGALDRTGQCLTLWNTDAVWYGESTTPLYKSIPFFLSARPGLCCGTLLDNTHRSVFDFGRSRRGVLGISAEGGPIDLYTIAGADARAVLTAYADLTGRPPLPPLWALGFQQSRFSYMSGTEVLEIARELRARRFPTDAIYCDIDYQDRYRPFTVDTTRFPDLPGLVGNLASLDVKLVIITDLHIAKVTDEPYPPYETGLAGGHFARWPEDGRPYVGGSWPGDAVFPDFTRGETRRWWGSLYEGFVQAGVAGFWNDMNEPSVASDPTGTMPLDVVHQVEEAGDAPRIAPHSETHNVLGMLNARATYEGLSRLRPDERPFVLTRASYAGGQRYAWTWTGDNSATWNHLRMSTPMLVNAGLSGMPFIGADLGGFFGAPSPDLLTRWFQIGAFHPLFRNHCFKESPRREPWCDGPEHENLRRLATEERYRLLPYIYTLAEEASRTGLPLVRPLFFECPTVLSQKPWFDNEPDAQFCLGSALMIAPPGFPDMRHSYAISLPEGPWYDYWSGLRIHASAIRAEPRLEHLPVFARGGLIIPRGPLVQSTAERPDNLLELLVFPDRNGRAEGAIYTDDGHSTAYRAGDILRQQFRYESGEHRSRLELLPRAGQHPPWWDRIEVVVHGSGSRSVQVTGEGLTLLRVATDPRRHATRFLFADNSAGRAAHVSFEA